MRRGPLSFCLISQKLRVPHRICAIVREAGRLAREELGIDNNTVFDKNPNRWISGTRGEREKLIINHYIPYNTEIGEMNIIIIKT